MNDPPASAWILSLERRLISVSIAGIALLLSFLPMLLIAALVRLTSPGPVLFRQDRVGRHGKIFQIYKFRTMFDDHGDSTSHTREGDARITPLGRHLRRLKLDELPQLLNVLCGDMAIIGPRPKLSEHTELHKMPYRPGLTGPATLAFRHEESLLRNVAPGDLDTYYARSISPLKARLDVCYMCRGNAASDIRILVATAVSLVAPKRASALGREILGPVPITGHPAPSCGLVEAPVD